MSDVVSIPVTIQKMAKSNSTNKEEYVNPLGTLNSDEYDLSSVVYNVTKASIAHSTNSETETNTSNTKNALVATNTESIAELLSPQPKFYLTNANTSAIEDKLSSEKKTDNESESVPEVTLDIPIYVGIGLRVTANVNVIKTNTNISGLGVIGMEAESNSLNGALIIQTLGINGESVSSALPIQSELNRTTAQNAIVSIAQVKSMLYQDNLAIRPRIVGMYLPIAGNVTLVNAIVSELSKTNNIKWQRVCSTKNNDA